MTMKVSHMIIFTLIVSIVYSLVYLYFYRRFLKPHSIFHNISKTATRYWKLVLFSAVYAPIIPFFFFFYSGKARELITWGGFFMFGLIFTLFPLAVSRDLISFLAHIGEKLARKLSLKKTQHKPQPAETTPAIEQPGPPVLSRRDFLIKSNYLLLGLSGMSSIYGAATIDSPARVVKREAIIPELPDHLEGITIAQISDLHIGPQLKKGFMEKVVSQVNSLTPDIVAITGDLVDGRVADLREHTLPLKDLTPNYGTYFVTGNHEYYSGVEEWLPELNRLGIKTLVNTGELVPIKNPKKGEQGLYIAGVPDIREGKGVEGHHYDPAQAAQGAREGDLKILLAHQPLALEQTLEAGYDIQLSGHTHGGQFFPWNIFIHLIYPYAIGFHHHENRLWINVNPGTGFWGPPLRLGVPSEITLITLTSKPENHLNKA